MSDLIPLSAIQHYSYCPRQWGLIHLEQEFAENVFTMRGNAAHALVDDHGIRQEKGARVERALPLYSLGWNLVGKADLVEFHPDGTVYPVEYKHGPKRAKRHDELQLAAQAVCLEEMLGKPVPLGAIYHVTSKRRREVVIDDTLRQHLREALAAIRDWEARATLPPPVNDDRCRNCSLIEICQPAALVACQQGHTADSLYTPDEDA
jgi:CRISPR-associated exonuclease Cas4